MTVLEAQMSVQNGYRENCLMVNSCVLKDKNEKKISISVPQLKGFTYTGLRALGALKILLEARGLQMHNLAEL